MEWGAALGALLTLLTLLAKAFIDSKKKKEDNSNDSNVQDMRQSLSTSDTDGVNARLADQSDRVRQALRDSAGRGNDPDKKTAS